MDAKSIRSCVKRLWQKTGLNRRALLWCGAILSVLLYFDILWCATTTFQPFSHMPLWLSAVTVSLLLTLIPNWTRRMWPGALVLVLLGLLLESNLLYSRTYFTAIPLSSYAMAANLDGFMDAVWASLRWTDLGFVLIIALWLWVIRKNKASEGSAHKMRTLYWAGTALLLWCLCFGVGRSFHDRYNEERNSAYLYASGPAMYTVFGSLYFNWLQSTATLDAALEKRVTAFLDNPPALTGCTYAASRPAPENVVFVFCESLESWVIGLEIDGMAVTPNINAMVADSTTLYLPNVVTQVGAGRSIDSQLLNLAGLYPLDGATYSTECPSSTYMTLPKALKSLRPTTAWLLTSDKLKTWNQGQVAQAFGIDRTLSYPDWDHSDEMWGNRGHVGDRVLARQIVQRMKTGEIWPSGHNAFVQIVFYSGHAPFKIPDQYKTLHLRGPQSELVKDYAECAHYTDEGLGTLVDYLRTRPDWDRTMVVIVGDHEGLAAERRAAHGSEPRVDPAQHTPLIILNSPVGGRIDTPIGQVDTYPTLLALTGAGSYPWHGVGRSIFAPDAGNAGDDRRDISEAIIRFDMLRGR